MIDTIHLSFFYQNSDLLFVQYPSFFPHQLYNPNLLFIMIDTIRPSFLSEFYSSICPTPSFFFFRILFIIAYLFFIINATILIYYSTELVLYPHPFYQNSILLFAQLLSFFSLLASHF